MRRGAPVLELTVHRHRWWRRAVTALALLALGGLAAWVLGAPDRWPLALSLCALVLWAVRAAVSVPPLRLRFDGQGWHWRPVSPVHGVGGSGRVQVVLDLGDRLLLCLLPAGGKGPRRWVPVDASDAPSLWHALRCAVYCRTPGDDPLAVSNSPDA